MVEDKLDRKKRKRIRRRRRRGKERKEGEEEKGRRGREGEEGGEERGRRRREEGEIGEGGVDQTMPLYELAMSCGVVGGKVDRSRTLHDCWRGGLVDSLSTMIFHCCFSYTITCY